MVLKLVKPKTVKDRIMVVVGVIFYAWGFFLAFNVYLKIDAVSSMILTLIILLATDYMAKKTDERSAHG